MCGESSQERFSLASFCKDWAKFIKPIPLVATVSDLLLLLTHSGRKSQNFSFTLNHKMTILGLSLDPNAVYNIMVELIRPIRVVNFVVWRVPAGGIEVYLTQSFLKTDFKPRNLIDVRMSHCGPSGLFDFWRICDSRSWLVLLLWSSNPWNLGVKRA